jgi:hypothetical protein
MLRIYKYILKLHHIENEKYSIFFFFTYLYKFGQPKNLGKNDNYYF